MDSNVGRIQPASGLLQLPHLSLCTGLSVVLYFPPNITFRRVEPAISFRGVRFELLKEDDYPVPLADFLSASFLVSSFSSTGPPPLDLDLG